MFDLIFIPLMALVLIYLQGFFSKSEMAMVSSNKIRLQYLATTGDKRAKIISNLLNQPNRLFGTTLLSINLATVTVSIISEIYFNTVIFDRIQFITKYIPIQFLIVLIMEPVILIFGELFPMSIGRKYPNTTSMKNAYFIKIAYLILFPFMFLISLIGNLLLIIFKANKESKLSRKDLEILVTGGFSSITGEVQDYIKEVLNINNLNAKTVMTHINDVKAISETSTVGELKKIINKTSYSRIPVYSNNILNIISTIHAMNILGVNDNEPIQNYTDKLYIIPSTKPIIQILKEFRKNRKYMGIVVDEFGAVCGILTLRDIIKEIIGDASDKAIKQTRISINKNIFDGSIYLDDFYEQTGVDLQNSDVSTLSGIINLAAGRIPRKGEIIHYKNCKFEILEATDRLVKAVKVTIDNIHKTDD